MRLRQLLTFLDLVSAINQDSECKQYKNDDYKMVERICNQKIVRRDESGRI